MSDVQPDNKRHTPMTWQCSWCGFFDPLKEEVAKHLAEEHNIDVDTARPTGWPTMTGHTHAWRFLRSQDGQDVFYCESCLEYRKGSVA